MTSCSEQSDLPGQVMKQQNHNVSKRRRQSRLSCRIKRPKKGSVRLGSSTPRRNRSNPCERIMCSLFILRQQFLRSPTLCKQKVKLDYTCCSCSIVQAVAGRTLFVFASGYFDTRHILCRFMCRWPVRHCYCSNHSMLFNRIE